MASVRIRRLNKRIGDRLVLRDIDLDIHEGELLVLVGPSGCGKTSLLRLVAGLEEPTSGEILVDGDAVADAHRGRRAIAMMFQEAALYPHLTVADNIGFPLAIAGERSSTIRQEVATMAAALGIRPLLGRLPGRLSGGQRQRVAMARSLIRRPELLLMDEPMSNLDAKLRVELRATIGQLQHRFGITTLYVTHDQTEAMSLGHRIALMRDGEIVQSGTPDQLFDDPVDAFVATFIGSPAMNLFVGRLRRERGVRIVEFGSFAVASGPRNPNWPADSSDGDAVDVIVGVRPHDFQFADTGAVVDVEHIETVGDRCLVTATLGTDRVLVTGDGVAIAPGPTPIMIDAAVGDRLGDGSWRASHLEVEPERIHLFDLRSGCSLRPSAAEADRQLTRAVT